MLIWSSHHLSLLLQLLLPPLTILPILLSVTPYSTFSTWSCYETFQAPTTGQHSSQFSIDLLTRSLTDTNAAITHAMSTKSTTSTSHRQRRGRSPRQAHTTFLSPSTPCCHASHHAHSTKSSHYHKSLSPSHHRSHTRMDSRSRSGNDDPTSHRKSSREQVRRHLSPAHSKADRPLPTAIDLSHLLYLWCLGRGINGWKPISPPNCKTEFGKWFENLALEPSARQELEKNFLAIDDWWNNQLEAAEEQVQKLAVNMGIPPSKISSSNATVAKLGDRLSNTQSQLPDWNISFLSLLLLSKFWFS